MAAETIIVEIDHQQMIAQKNNNYSLYLAKKVNGEFTVIWQSLGPIASVNHPSYEHTNTFEIQVPSYGIGYGNLPQQEGAVTFTSTSGPPIPINIGQTVAIDQNGSIGTPANGGPAGVITVNNGLAANPHEALYDSTGNLLFVNTASGMDIGTATLTPIDEYQIWFDSYQATGTIIAHNSSKVADVVFAGGDTTKTISYSASGEWQAGGLNESRHAALVATPSTLAIQVLATFSSALSKAAITFIAYHLIHKFAGGLKPKQISLDTGGTRLKVTFEDAKPKSFGRTQTDRFEEAVNRALNLAKADPAADLSRESWTLSESTITTIY